MEKCQRKSRRWQSVCALGVALASSVAGLSACGGISADSIVVRVGDQAISKGAVDHWALVIERGRVFAGSRGKPHGTAQQGALALLMSSAWLTGEAAQQGIHVSDRRLDETLIEREHTKKGLQQSAHESGQTVADLKLELRAELTAEALRDRLANRAKHITQAEVTSFYHNNIRLFSRPAVRVTDLIEGQPTAAGAVAIVRRLRAGQRFSERAIREHVTRTPEFMFTPEKAHVVNAIFAAQRGVVSRPILIDKNWAVFVVRKTIPAPPAKSLAQVRSKILVRLQAIRKNAIASEFDHVYRTRWRARTNCRRGFIGPGCRQSARALGPREDPFSTEALPL
jgi:hypothetical protein